MPIRLAPTCAGVDPAALARFEETFLYRPPAVLVDELVRVDPAAHAIDALLDTTRALPFAIEQRTGPGHPAHVSAAEMLMATGSLGCLSAWLFHGVRFDQGWSGFGNRVHRADFKALARLGPPLRLGVRETQWRDGPRRVVIRYAFTFEQEERVVYVGDQSAMFFHGLALDVT